MPSEGIYRVSGNNADIRLFEKKFEESECFTWKVFIWQGLYGDIDGNSGMLYMNMVIFRWGIGRCIWIQIQYMGVAWTL